MLTTRIDRYIFKELLAPTIISLAIFTFVLLGGRFLFLSELILNKGVPAGEVMKLLWYLLPIFMAITLPLSLFLGTLVGYSRLSRDNEITAFKASGISLARLFRPALLLGLLLTLCTSYTTLVAEPAAKIAFRSKVFDVVQQRASVGILSQVFNNDIPGVTLYVNKVDRSGDLHEVFISDERVDGDPAVIFARSGRIFSDPQEQSLTLHLLDGEIHRYPDRKNYQVLDFNSYDIKLHSEKLANQTARRRKFGEIPTFELLDISRTTSDQNIRRNTLAQFNRRFVHGLSPLVLILFSLPLTIKRGRSGQGTGFFVALVIFALFHVCQFLTETAVADSGWPALTIWGTPLLLGIIGILWLFLLSREIPLLPGKRRGHA